MQAGAPVLLVGMESSLAKQKTHQVLPGSSLKASPCSGGPQGRFHVCYLWLEAKLTTLQH